ncbi:MAG TPA: DUF6773 family protein [Syntrophomonadaceae bacterium]|nr:DUF6773 family protein [Syntrophomonadaceae bacterium]
MKHPLQDERVKLEVLRQHEQAFWILYFGLFLDLAYRQFILNEPAWRMLDLVSLFFGVIVFLAVKGVTAGLLIDMPSLKSIIPVAVLCTIISVVINLIMNRNNISPFELMIDGIAFFIPFTALFLLMHYISKRKNEKMLKDD